MLSTRRPNNLTRRPSHMPLSTGLLSRILFMTLVCFWASNTEGVPIHCPSALLVGDKHSVLRLPLNTSSARAMYGPPTEVVKSINSIHGLAVVGGFLYWIDNYEVWQTSLVDSNTTSILRTYTNIHQLIAEPVEKKLYFTTGGQVESYDLESGVRTTIPVNRLTIGLAVDRDSSLLFYSTLSPTCIYKANLDGSDATEIVTTGLSYVPSIAINYDKKRMCWQDKNKKLIECVDYFGNHRQVYNTTGRQRDLVILNDIAYYVQTSPARVVSMELTGGGERIIHDVGAYEEIESITVMDARGDLNCHTSEAYDRQLVESNGLELDPPMSFAKSAQLVDANNDTCVTIDTSAMYVYSVGRWNPQPQGKCWFPGLSIKRRVPEAIKASFTVTITGRRLVCSTSHVEVALGITKSTGCQLSGIYRQCTLSGPTTTGKEALNTCSARCVCDGNDCGHVTINIPKLLESWELCEIGIK